MTGILLCYFRLFCHDNTCSCHENYTSIYYFGRSSIEIPSTICFHTARSSIAPLISHTSNSASLATISKNVSGLRPRLLVSGNRHGKMLEMVWSDARMQWPANRALRCAMVVDMGGRSPYNRSRRLSLILFCFYRGRSPS